MYTCGYAHLSVGAHRRRRRRIPWSELQLWLLGNGLGSSVRTVRALNLWTISSSPRDCFTSKVVSVGASWCLKYFLSTLTSETSQVNSDTVGQAPGIGGWTNPPGKQCVQCESKKHLTYTDAATPPSTWKLHLKFGFRKITKLPLLLLWLYSTRTVECQVGLFIVWGILSLWIKTP